MTKIPTNTGESVFRGLVEAHSDRVYNLALLRSGRPHLAEDITQETFIRVYRALGSFRGDSELGTWIYRIAINVCNSVLSHENRYPLVEPDSREARSDNGLESTPSAEADFMEQSRKQIIRDAIRKLPEHQADAITLYFIKEHQYSEIAEIMQIPLNTVKSHIRRAKENLRTILKEVVI